MNITYTVRYRRPEAPWSLAKMTLTTDYTGIITQIGRLQALGYTIAEISPPPVEPPVEAPAAIISLAS